MDDSPSPETIAATGNFRDAVERRAREIAERLAPTAFEGRGIVVVAGGARVFVNAYVLISVLRQTLGCTLPMELWHFGREEVSAAMAATLEPFGVRLVDAVPIIEAAGLTIRDGWQLKSVALLWSRFREALFLDADQVPTRDPGEVFDWPEYRETGAVFWPDIIDISAANAVWSLVELPPEDGVSLESGQMVVDKPRHREALSMSVALNEAAETLYRIIYGDKDTFLLAWKMTAAPAAIVPHRPFIDDRCLFQRDFQGAPLFQHRTGGKWTYSGEQFRIPGFVHEEACLAALERLRELWSGRVFNPPARSEAARAAEQRLVAIGRFKLDVADEVFEPLELRPHGELGVGRAVDRQNWFVADSDKGLMLAIRGPERVYYEFAETDGGIWTGTRWRLPMTNASLIPAEPESATAEVYAGLVDDFLGAGGFWNGAGGDASILATLKLLARVETGVGERLLALAEKRTADEPLAAERLRKIAYSLAKDCLSSSVTRDIQIIAKGYHSPDEVSG